MDLTRKCPNQYPKNSDYRSLSSCIFEASPTVFAYHKQKLLIWWVIATFYGDCIWGAIFFHELSPQVRRLHIIWTASRLFTSTGRREGANECFLGVHQCPFGYLSQDSPISMSPVLATTCGLKFCTSSALQTINTHDDM